MSGDNKLTFDPPTHLPELTLNLTRSSRGHYTPFLKVSCKSVQPLLMLTNADKEISTAALRGFSELSQN